MIICANCKREMLCEQTGLGARWGKDHVYAGDAFRCSDCGAFVIRTNDQSTFDPKHLIETIQMEEA